MFPSDEEFVKHIRDEAGHIRDFMVGKTIDDLRADFMLERAVTRCLEIMDEASRKVSTEYKQQHQDLPPLLYSLEQLVGPLKTQSKRTDLLSEKEDGNETTDLQNLNA